MGLVRGGVCPDVYLFPALEEKERETHADIGLVPRRDALHCTRCPAVGAWCNVFAFPPLAKFDFRREEICFMVVIVGRVFAMFVKFG